MNFYQKTMILFVLLNLLGCHYHVSNQTQNHSSYSSHLNLSEKERFMQEFSHAYHAQDWEKTNQIVSQITKQYLDKQDSQGLVLFWQDFLKQNTSHSEWDYVSNLVKNTDDFQKDIRHLLKAGIQKHQNNQNIKAFYYEYFYDGGDASTGNLFLCLDFNQSNGDWASNFEDLVQGNLISQYFNYFYHHFSSEIAYDIARNYTHAVLLDVFIREVKNTPLPIPIGFADHDNNHRTVIILPNSEKIMTIF